MGVLLTQSTKYKGWGGGYNVGTKNQGWGEGGVDILLTQSTRGGQFGPAAHASIPDFISFFHTHMQLHTHMSVGAAAQVNGCVLKGSWNASTRSVQLHEDTCALLSQEKYSITLPEPALLLPDYQPGQPIGAHSSSNSISFTSCISMPNTDTELVGWQQDGGGVENVHQGQEGVLQLLAHMRGRFLPVQVTEISRAADGVRTLLVRSDCFGKTDSAQAVKTAL